MNKYAGLLRIKALLDAYLAALADEGRQAIQDALAEFLGEHPEVLAVAWYQGAGLSHLTFELRDGVRYLAAEDQIIGAAMDDTFDTADYAAFADVLWNALDVLVAKFGFDVNLRATREDITALPIAA
ncbi:MAG: hypothetical protein EPO40_22015 [Myxococcaceae bacterium]|nr:MAG: hypothetical protein EPO40_22015 [Myxococcaceae bacterium]